MSVLWPLFLQTYLQKICCPRLTDERIRGDKLVLEAEDLGCHEDDPDGWRDVDAVHLDGAHCDAADVVVGIVVLS